MIRNESTSRPLARTPYALRRTPPRTSLWRRLGDGWTRAWNRTNLECSIDEEVRRQFQHRPAEPGDVVLVNMIAEEMSRRQPR